jgi:transposase
MEGRGEGVILPAVSVDTVEAEVIGEGVWGAIRALWASGKKKKQIARELSLDIKTVRKWVDGTWVAQKRRPRGRLLDDFRAFLEGRAAEVGFNGEVLLREVRGLGYTGSYSTLADYIAPWRRAWRGEPEPTVRFETGPGEQSQVDWGSTKVWLSEDR